MKKILLLSGILIATLFKSNVFAQAYLDGLILHKAELLLNNVKEDARYVYTQYQISTNDKEQVVNFNHAQVKLTFIDHKHSIAKTLLIPVAVQSKFPRDYEFETSKLKDHSFVLSMDQLQDKPISAIFGRYNTTVGLSSSSASFYDAFNKQSQVRIFELQNDTEDTFIGLWLLTNKHGSLYIVKRSDARKDSNVIVTDENIKKDRPDYVSLDQIENETLK